MVYQYKWRATQYAVSAQEAGEFLHNMSEKEGGLTAKRVLDVSRSEDALLHPCFEWDDTKAAEAHRLAQARGIIGNIVCVVVKDEKEQNTEPVRAFVNVSDQTHSETGVFKPIVKALGEEESKRYVLKNALNELIAFQNKYKTFTELAPIFEAIGNVLATVNVDQGVA